MIILSLEQASWTYFDQTHSTPFNAGIFFSDGGSKHFKCCYTMAVLAAIANPSTIHPSQPIGPWISDIIDADVLLKLRHPHELSYHFCASYHGHSLADGHFSQLKRLSNQAYVASAYEINNKQPHQTSHHFNTCLACSMLCLSVMRDLVTRSDSDLMLYVMCGVLGVTAADIDIDDGNVM